MPETTCSHISAISTGKHPKRQECEDCVKIGAKWVHLRTCQECGGTRCCDDSPNKHATKHASTSKHPVIASGNPVSVGCTVTRTTPLRNIDYTPMSMSASRDALVKWNTSIVQPCDEAVILSSPAAAPCSAAAAPWILAATILGSSLAFIDGSVVNLALPAFQADLNATVIDAQWVVEAYALLLVL